LPISPSRDPAQPGSYEEALKCEKKRKEERKRRIVDLPVRWNIRTVLWGGTEHSQGLFLLE